MKYHNDRFTCSDLIFLSALQVPQRQVYSLRSYIPKCITILPGKYITQIFGMSFTQRCMKLCTMLVGNFYRRFGEAGRPFCHCSHMIIPMVTTSFVLYCTEDRGNRRTRRAGTNYPSTRCHIPEDCTIYITAG